MKPFKLPENFLLGSATAAEQIEGGDKNNNWYDWCIKGHIKDNSTCLRANEHWERFRDDIELMKALNHKTYRMGLSWSRIEPEEGKFDPKAIEHYREELELLRSSGIVPLITLHHFAHPLWLVEKGGFEDKSVLWYFERYVKHVVSSLGDLASDFITFNEPNVYALYGYFYGTWPPGRKSLRLYNRVLRNMTICHIKAYKLIHKIRRDNGFTGETKVGLAHHLRVFDPYNRYNPLDIMTARLMEYLFQDMVMKSMSSGFLRPPMGFGIPLTAGKYQDFLGINYYSRTAARFKGFQDSIMPGGPRNDLGWEIYPEGLYRLCKKYSRIYHIPIWITENGTCDANDSFRARFIYDHLYQASRLCDEGVRIERYYHWTLMDNFEWLEGESAPFGLYHVDFETQRRTLRKSGEFYAELSRSNEVKRCLSP